MNNLQKLAQKRLNNLYSNEQIQKSIEDNLEKGGEGSRGGKIIGHTKSGKPIYQSMQSHWNKHQKYLNSDGALTDKEDSAFKSEDEFHEHLHDMAHAHGVHASEISKHYSKGEIGKHYNKHQDHPMDAVEGHSIHMTSVYEKKHGEKNKDKVDKADLRNQELAEHFAR